MGKTTAQKDAHAVKDGIRPAVGDTTKAYFGTKLQPCYIIRVTNIIFANESFFYIFLFTFRDPRPKTKELPGKRKVKGLTN